MREDPYNDPYGQSEQSEIAQRRSMLTGLLRGRWHWAILLAVLLAVAGGYLGYHSQGDLYRAQTFIDIKPDYSGVAVDITDLSVNERYINFVNGEIRRLKSVEVIESAMGTRVWQENLARRPDHLSEITIDSFSNNITLSEPGKNDDTLLYVRYEDADRYTAAAGVNALLEAYKEKQKQEQSTDIRENVRLLTDQKADLEAERRDKVAEIADLIPDEDVDNLRARRTRLGDQLSRLESILTTIDLELKPYESLKQDESPASRQELMLQDPDMQALVERREVLQRQLEEMTEVLGWGENHTDVKRTRTMLSQVDRKVIELETRWLENPQQQVEQAIPDAVAELRARRRVVLDQITEKSQLIADLNAKLSSIAGIERDLDELGTKIREIDSKIDGFKTSITFMSQDDISRIQPGPEAVTPTTPWNAGKRVQLAGVGSIGGFFVGFGMVMLVGVFDRRLRHVSDTTMGMPDTNVLGILPTLPADLTDPEEAETAAHCVHHIRTLLQIGGSNRVFSITSPAAGSGKSSLATALGMSFAATGTRTLVIDCDLVGAGLSRRMGTVVHEPLDQVIRRHNLLDEADLARAQTLAAAHERPLEQVLIDENLMSQDDLDTAVRLQHDSSVGLLNACTPGKLRGCVAATGIEHFFILPVGKARPSDASKLSPTAVRELIRQAREAFDIVLIDTGPVLGSLEASITAAESDATVLIVSRGDQKSLAARTLEQLRSVRANIAGVVFNHALERDLDHTSYASVISQERRPDRATRKRRLDQTRSARLGPLGTAVASYSDDDDTPAINGTANGHARNGQEHDLD
ncbi:MAG: exopolysaccharide transport family protein [Phycisphaeraceae bacterium]